VESRGVLLIALVVGLAGVTADGFAAECGKAAWYDLSGITASGERSDGSILAAAHRSLPFGTKVRVENLANGRAVVVRVNDRGPSGGRVIDVTRAAAEKLGMIEAGVARVRVSLVEGNARLPDSCPDPEPGIVTAAAVAAEAVAGESEAPEPAADEPPGVAAAVVPGAAEPPAAEEPVAPLQVKADPPGANGASTDTVASEAAAAAPGEGDGNDPRPREVLVATVLYDEAGEDDPPRRPRTSGGTATFLEVPADPDAETAPRIVAPEEETVTTADIPLPRVRPPGPPRFEPFFDRMLALRFLDAFGPTPPAFPGTAPATQPLGFAPVAPRGAVITE
jgi:rare lipoprotein A